MPTTIALGRDASLNVGGSPLTGVRSVTVSHSRKDIEVEKFDDGETYVLPGQRTMTLEVETVAREDYETFLDAMDDPTMTLSMSGSVSATFCVTSLTVSEPLDDVVFYTATLKRTVNPNA